MRTETRLACQVAGCENSIPAPLLPEVVCLAHFLQTAMAQLETTAAKCRAGEQITTRTLDELRMHADCAVQFLADGSKATPDANEQMLQLILALANLHEYLSHHVSLVAQTR